jgi:hypothetical protein
MKLIQSNELEQLVRSTFPSKEHFSAERELGLRTRRAAPVAFVHGGIDPFLDRQFDDWVAGQAAFVPLYQLLNRLCRAGALPPGTYAIT